MDREDKLEITLGDLIEVLTEETLPLVHDEREAYKLVSFMLGYLLCGTTTSRTWQSWH